MYEIFDNMCGIVGLKGEFNQDDIISMMEIIKTRGMDSHGFYLKNQNNTVYNNNFNLSNFVSDNNIYNIGIGHNLLSIFNFNYDDNCLNLQPLVYNTLDQGGCYLSFSFNIFGIIDSVVYLGKKHIDYRALVSLVGLHETYLDKLLNRFEGDLITDIPEFLSENWALALYHDKFSQLVINLKAILHEKDIFDIVSDVVGKEKPLDRVVINELLEQVGKRTKAKIEYEIVNFLNENRNHLPFYHIPFLQQPEDAQPTNDEEEKEANNDLVDNLDKVKNEENEENKSVKDKTSKENSRHDSASSKKSENK